MGIEQVGQIQEMPIEIIKKMLGENGQMLWKMANGIDNSLVEAHSEKKSISTETTFDKDTTDIQQLKRVLITMIEGLAFDLRKKNKVTGCLSLKLRYSDFQTHTFQSKIAYTASDHVLLDKVLALFKKNYTRRVLIRLIGIKFSLLIPGQTQINLFDDTEEMINLYQSLDKIRLRFGYKAIMKSVGLKTKK